ncbi:MAG: alkaline phosphatase D [Akkermansiaceae bacterium]|jgi:alkaline phosphatase D
MNSRHLFALLATSLAYIPASHGAIVSYWSFDTDFTSDLGGPAFDLTPSGGATAGDPGGRFGNAASFDRARSQFASTGGDVLTAGINFSYSAWFNFSVADITDSSRYFVLETSAGDTPSGSQAWTASIGLRDQNTATTEDELQIFSSTPSAAVGQTIMTNNVWQNVIVTFDADGGVGASGLYTAYLNGTGFASVENTSGAVGGLVIGGHRTGTGRNFDGQIDDVAFFDTVLSPGEISFLQSSPANAIPEPTSAFLLTIGSLAFLRRRR